MTGSVPGLVIWAVSFCRSTVATYLALSRFLPCEVRLVVFGPKENPLRQQAGFSSSEFEMERIDLLSPTPEEARDFLERHAHFAQMFCAYQSSPVFRALIGRCREASIPYFLASEAPLNMEGPGARRLLKDAYLRSVLPLRVRGAVAGALFFVNYSGDGNDALLRLGWSPDSIEPFGYFPPPLPGSNCITRTGGRPEGFTFLMSGIHTWHRDPLTFVKALRILRETADGRPFRGVVCGEGPLTAEVAAFVAENDLPVELRGFVGLPELVEAYETANAFVAAGVSEPWGIRVNDAMQCGCPCIVSDGMGANRLVRDTGFGAVFRAGDPRSLAGEMARLMQGEEDYRRLAGRAPSVAGWLSPETRGRDLADRLSARLGL